MRTAVFALVLAAPVAAEPLATPSGLDGFVTLDRLAVPRDPILAAGREIWGETCENCHGGNKLTGAPKITSTDAWAPRIAQGLDLLVTHATEGFIGPKYTQMPARGGNPDLSDAAIQAAVAFMVWASGDPETAVSYAATSIEKDQLP